MQPAQWRKRVSELTGIQLSQVLIITQGWTTAKRDKVLELLLACQKKASLDTNLDRVLLIIDEYRNNGSPSVKKLIADVDEALLQLQTLHTDTP